MTVSQAIATTEEDREIGPHSPCIGICELDAVSGVCLGCARTKNEIAAWGMAEPAHRDAIWHQLPDRQDRLDIYMRILPWSPAAIVDWTECAVRTLPGSIADLCQTPVREFRTGPQTTLRAKRSPPNLLIGSPPVTIVIPATTLLRAISTKARTPSGKPSIVIARQTAAVGPANNPTTQQDASNVASLPEWLRPIARFTPDNSLSWTW